MRKFERKVNFVTFHSTSQNYTEALTSKGALLGGWASRMKYRRKNKLGLILMMPPLGARS